MHVDRHFIPLLMMNFTAQQCVFSMQPLVGSQCVCTVTYVFYLNCTLPYDIASD
jgi:hypothetical protein